MHFLLTLLIYIGTFVACMIACFTKTPECPTEDACGTYYLNRLDRQSSHSFVYFISSCIHHTKWAWCMHDHLLYEGAGLSDSGCTWPNMDWIGMSENVFLPFYIILSHECVLQSGLDASSVLYVGQSDRMHIQHMKYVLLAFLAQWDCFANYILCCTMFTER